MDCLETICCLQGYSFYKLLFIIWLSNFQRVLMLHQDQEPIYISTMNGLASPPNTKLFDPIEISPSVLPDLPNLAPYQSMLPIIPITYEPVLTGKCPVNFTLLSNILDKTVYDCFKPFASVLGNVVCCPQFSSLIYIVQGVYSARSDKLVLETSVANDCFNDIISILTSRNANNTISTICSIKSSNLTGGTCPLKDVGTFEKMVNTSKLLEACSTVDPLKECCRPVCQPAIMEAAFRISGGQFANLNNNNNNNSSKNGEEPNHTDVLSDCKGVVYSWLSSKLSLDSSNAAFRVISACKVNKVCPLNFKHPTKVIKACRNDASPSLSCCDSLNAYITGIQKQMLITNKQAILCATDFGSMLRKGGVVTNVYELCEIDLKDFSVQDVGGCLLRSLPTDMVLDKETGLAFRCDLSDDIAAPWPSSSSVSSVSFCAPEVSLPALPTSKNVANNGCWIECWVGLFVSVFSFSVFGITL